MSYKNVTMKLKIMKIIVLYSTSKLKLKYFKKERSSVFQLDEYKNKQTNKKHSTRGTEQEEAREGSWESAQM